MFLYARCGTHFRSILPEKLLVLVGERGIRVRVPEVAAHDLETEDVADGVEAGKSF